MIPNGPGACHRVPSTTVGTGVSRLNSKIFMIVKNLQIIAEGYFAQTSNNGTITTGSQGTCDAAQMSGSHLSSGTFFRSRIGNCP